MKNKFAKILIILAVLAVPVFFLPAIARNAAKAESAPALGDASIDYNQYYAELQKKYAENGMAYSGGAAGSFPVLPEITEEQRQNMDRMLKMPVGKMNPDIWLKISSQWSCLMETKQISDKKLSEEQLAEIVAPYGVTGEEYVAFYLQMMSGKLDTSKFENYNVDIFSEKTKKDYEDLKKNNCRVAGVGKKKAPDIASSTAAMTDAIWFETTARIRCLDRISLSFTKYELNRIFGEFGVTVAEYNVYNREMMKRLEALVAKDENLWTDSDTALILQYRDFKTRLETLKKNNCVLDDGKPISEEYAPPPGWDTDKCGLFTCDTCYRVTDSSSFWEKYRCKSLCSGCPVGTPPVKIVTNCFGFCSLAACPDYADQITGTCALEKVCTKCGLWNLFKCCKEKETVCCQPKPKPVCSCSIKTCPAGLTSEGEKDCPGGTEKYKCGPFKWFTCKRAVSGVCCK
ncbi:MAG: hypothetical protein PHE24_06160 [Patescibacteria group bacterium]|nr:hypothetical protein [Patescibacteria group bacterium]